MHRNRKRRSLLVLAAIGHASVLLALPAIGNAQTTPNPQTGEGYPEPRICPETQQWWTQDSDNENPQPDDVLNGRDEHTHLKVCIPAPGVPVSGDVRFDFVWQIHEMDDGYPKTFRIQSGSNTLRSVDTSPAERAECAGVTQCQGTKTIVLDTDTMATGCHELRFHHESERTDDSGALATTGWHLCVRALSPVVAGGGRAVSPPVWETRGGWFETGIGQADDFRYVVARVEDGMPANAQGLVPQTGDYCPDIRTLTTTIGDTSTPIVRSFVSVGAAWHKYDVPGHPNGYPGDVIVDQAGPMDREVCIDTTQYPDGSIQRLYVRADGQTPSGKTGGVFTYDFLIGDNGNDPEPTPTPTATPTATPTPPPGDYNPPCRPDCEQIIADLRTENATLEAQNETLTGQRDQAVAQRDAAIAARDEALADLQAMTTSRNEERERADAAEDKLDRIAAILQEPSRRERALAITEE